MTQASSEGPVQAGGETRPLGRAFLVSLALLIALSAAAFWPERAWKVPPRPPLQTPIVLDELVHHPPPPSDAIPGAPSGAR